VQAHQGGRAGVYDVVLARSDGTVIALYRGTALRLG
jgi:hypothetical protein